MTRAQAIRQQQDPTMSALRTDGARLIMADLRRTYARADAATSSERRELLKQAAVLSQAMRNAEMMA